MKKRIYTDPKEIEIHCKAFDEGYYKFREEELEFLKSLTWFNMNKKVRLRIDKRIKELEGLNTQPKSA